MSSSPLMCFSTSAIFSQFWPCDCDYFNSLFVVAICNLKNCAASTILLYVSVFVCAGVKIDLMNIGILVLNSV